MQPLKKMSKKIASPPCSFLALHHDAQVLSATYLPNSTATRDLEHCSATHSVCLETNYIAPEYITSQDCMITKNNNNNNNNCKTLEHKLMEDPCNPNEFHRQN